MSEDKQLTIAECFGKIEDPRVERSKKHLLIDVITIALCSIISGGEGFNDMAFFAQTKEDWLKKFLKLTNGIPSHDTFRRVLGMIDPQKFTQSFQQWVGSSVADIEERQIAIDGKALRSSGRKKKKNSVVHIVSAWCTENGGLLLGQTKTNSKSNEITAIPELLDTLILKGAIVSIDAIGCQRNIAEQIINQESDYFLALKGNQKSIFNEVQHHFSENIEHNIESRNEDNFHDYYEFLYGTSVRRRVWTINDITMLESLEEWPGIKSIAVIEAIRTCKKTDDIVAEYRYYLSSIEELNSKQANDLIRKHWSVENDLHWSLDVVFSEDQSRINDETGATNIGFLRRFAVTLFKQENSKISLKQKKMKCALDDNYRAKVLLTLSKI